MDNNNCNVKAAIDAGKQIADTASRIANLGEIPVAIVPEGMRPIVLLELLAAQDQRGAAPRRLKGTAVHHEVSSFIAHVNRFKTTDSVVWADAQKANLTAVYNYHGGSGKEGGQPVPRWGDHCAVYSCPLSVEWQRWMGLHEKWMVQETFGQFIEDNLIDLASPDPNDTEFPMPARVLEVARSLQINAKRQFERTINPSTGEGVFSWKEEHEPKGTTKVPKGFLLGLPVFDAGDRYRLEARLRYQVEGGQAKFQYSLYQPQHVLRDAFNKVRQQVGVETGLAVFAGTPER